MILEHFKLLKDNYSQKNLLVVPQAQQSKQQQ